MQINILLTAISTFLVCFDVVLAYPSDSSSRLEVRGETYGVAPGAPANNNHRKPGFDDELDRQYVEAMKTEAEAKRYVAIYKKEFMKAMANRERIGSTANDELEQASRGYFIALGNLESTTATRQRLEKEVNTKDDTEELK
ncbi:hypothetical protein FRC03_000849 [Tulasnella sp. 419]|nr:hypothetical protein FRC02_001220 [Tulasnella sp. 418]KAG8948074.1 hypothetical protein FRC03_000849 [Tulasnella sp. 419]